MVEYPITGTNIIQRYIYFSQPQYGKPITVSICIDKLKILDDLIDFLMEVRKYIQEVEK